MAKKFGIDLGSSSLGWFLRDGDTVLKNGVVTFDTGMKKDQGGYSSPTKNRREARSKRKLIQARKYRKWELLEILIEHHYVPLRTEELENWSKYKKGQQRKYPETENFQKWLTCDFSYENGIKYNNPYELRVKAIDNKLSKHELGRTLYHIVQRRGYKDIGEKNNETKTQIERRGESGFKTAMENNRTIAEALSNEFLKKGKRARNQYPYRAEYENELATICEAQGFDVSQNDKKEYNDEFVRKLRKAIIWQRPLRSQKGNIGKCTLEPTKNRCSTSHPIFEIFRTWQYINTIKTVEHIDKKHSVTKEIPQEFKKLLFREKFLKKDRLKFDEIQKFLDKQFKAKKEYNYFNKRTQKYDSSVSGMPICKGLINIFGDKIINEIENLHTYNIGTKEHSVVGNYSVYDLWHLIYETDNDHLENFAETKLGIKTIIKTNKKGEEYRENPVVKFKNSAFTTSYSNLSVKAMCKIIPFLQEGFLYNDAVLLAKIPENIDNWVKNKDLIYSIIKKSNKIYNFNKNIVYITNSLIDKYKALGYNEELKMNERFADNYYEYQLQESDRKQIEKTCISFYGEKTWEKKEEKNEIINNVALKYQEFFKDTKRDYRKVPTLTKIIQEELKKEGIELKGELYHHSDRKNLYLEKLPINKKTGKYILPKHPKTKETILPIPLIDSIKNPMFNKSMSILRKLINELIVQTYVDKDGVTQHYLDENTEIIIEVARDLNDKNKRIAIERYQKDRENERERIREFIKEFKGEDSKSIEKDISKFQIWSEQLFNEPNDTKKHINKKEEILAEKDALKRYKLWAEQKGQCMYTGKMISISQLFSAEIQIEHTIPRSLLPDNTMANQTVCFSKYNSDIKNNRIPTECPNYETDKNLPEVGNCTAIEPRLKKWKEIRDKYKKLYESRTKPFGNEDEAKKDKRIQEKHYYKMYFDYWRDKVNRFTTNEIKDNWVRRQLTDTQMVSKYAREFLKTYFKKVLVQKGSTTADFRKIFGIQGEEKKDRSKHTHHSIDAAVLTLIPTNSSKRVELLNKMYKLDEKEGKQFRADPDGFHNFNAQSLIKTINDNTLIVNYKKDKITEQTYRNVRKRGKLQYLKDKKGNFVLDKNGNKILLKARGASIRGDLFKDTYIGKIKNVKRDETGKPKRNSDGSWEYKTGKEEFTYTKRVKIEEIKNFDDIIDPDIRKIIVKQHNDGVDIRKIKDHQGNIIRHVRVKIKAGRKVKERINYKSKHEYKNTFYSMAGEIPYAIFITNLINGRIERKMIPIPIHEVAQTFKEYHKFTPELYLEKFHEEIKEYQDLKLLKVGQKVFVLKNDNEYENRKDIKFQINRMYKIKKFYDDGANGIYLKYHLEATKDDDIDKKVKESKHLYLKKYDEELGLNEIIEDTSIVDIKERKKDYNDKKYRFVGLKDERFKRLIPFLGEDKVKEIKKEIGKYKKQSSIIEKEGETPLLKITSTDCNFLYENYDFNIDITGKIIWIEE